MRHRRVKGLCGGSALSFSPEVFVLVYVAMLLMFSGFLRVSVDLRSFAILIRGPVGVLPPVVDFDCQVGPFKKQHFIYSGLI